MLIPLVILAMLVATRGLNSRAHVAREVQLVLAGIEADVHELDGLEWRTAAGRTVSQAVQKEVDELFAGVSADLDGLLRGHVDPKVVEPIAESFGRYRGALVEVLHLRHAGLEEEALEVDEEQVDPTFDELHDRLHAVSIVLSADAQATDRLRDIGSIAALALGGLLVAGLVLRASRVRRNLAASLARTDALQESERYFLSLLASSADLVAVLDRQGHIKFMSAAIEGALGWRPDDVVGRDLRELLESEDAGGLSARLENVERHEGVQESVDWRMRTADGNTVTMEAIVRARFDDPDIQGYLVNIRDQSERLVLEEALRHQAFHDPLTNLPNRVLFEDRLKHAYERTSRNGRSLCLLLADLDDFKDINDTFGHAFGDDVLVQVAERLREALRAEDTVARLGGDEFAVLIEDVEAEHDGVRAAERIIATLGEPVVIGPTEVYAHASIGIVTGSATGAAKTEDPTGQLLIEADLAMYEAKRGGRGQFQFYAPAMQEGIRERMMMRSDLEHGLNRGEFLLHYQPILSIKTETIVGAEALVRWQHPDRGLVPPMEFIPLAEQTGLIVDLGRWVLREACREAAGWRPFQDGSPAPYVTVNVAGSQLLQPLFVDEVAAALAESGLRPGRLVIEMTESGLIEDTEGNELKLEQLRKLGVRLAIDDFGTGYSSLSYLRRFDLDILKIDKSFVDMLGRDVKGSALVAAMVAMGSALSMDVVAEGIEDRRQLQDLRSLHCDLAQGYLFARPVPPADLAVLLQAEAGRAKVGANPDGVEAIAGSPRRVQAQ